MSTMNTPETALVISANATVEVKKFMAAEGVSRTSAACASAYSRAAARDSSTAFSSRTRLPKTTPCWCRTDTVSSSIPSPSST